MGNTGKKKSKKFTKKIKIRLVDPNIPNSYICEIFDSSLENEEDEFSKNDDLSEKEKDNSKPKNYFELLMSKHSKKNDIITTMQEREVFIFNDDKLIQKKDPKSIVKNKNLIIQPVVAGKKKIICETRPSQDGSQLHVQKINHMEDIMAELQSSYNKDVQDENLITIFDSPKVKLSQKKTLSILNYFSKKGTSSNNQKHQETEEKSQVINSLGISQSAHSAKPNEKSGSRFSSEKPCPNEAKEVLLKDLNKENMKLAPLFCRKGNKITDLAKQKARLEFLYKGSPFAIKKSENKTVESIFNFPIIPHVQQRNESAYWSLRQIYLPLPEVCHSECIFSGNKTFNLHIQNSNMLKKAISKEKISCNKELFCKIKYKYLELGIGSIIEGLKDKNDKYIAQVKEIEKSKIKSLKVPNDEMGYEVLNTLWTEKYKPKSNEILGNANAVKKLRKWLQSWKSFDDELKVLSKYNETSKNNWDNSDDDKDFLDFRSENYGLKAPGNVCIIFGPNGCGKTALVYALANELEFGVLELNASSKRTGRKVLSDLQEATRSHKVHRMNLVQNVGLQKPIKSKSKKNKKKSEPIEDLDQPYDREISLILIEDAEIVFDDHDEGFYSAIASLVQTSKRPLIFLTNEPNCLYLENFKTDQCLILEMEPPNFYKSCAVLDVISSLEGFLFEKELLEDFLCKNSFDLRKSLLELQFWVGSGRNIENIQKVFDLGHLWWGLSKFLFKQDIKHFMKFKSRKRKRVEDLFDSSDDEVETAAKKFKLDSKSKKDRCLIRVDAIAKISDLSIESYFKVLDFVSILDGFSVTKSQEPIPGYECQLKDSLSLNENMEEVSWNKRRLAEQFSDEIMTLSTRIFAERFKKEESEYRKLNFVSPCWEETRWRNSQAKAHEELSRLISLQRGRDKRSLYLDYLPILRNICRIERHRSEMNPKRKNRFHHYLNNFGIELTDENLEISCEAFDR